MPVTCTKLEENFLHAYVDGEFSSEESAEVKAHLDGCDGCARAEEAQRQLKGAVLLAQRPAPHALHDSVRARLVEEVELAQGGRWGRAFREPRSIAAAAAVVGAAAWFLAGGLQHPVLGTNHSLVDDGVALHARALPLDFAASDPGSAQRWLQGKVDFGVRLPRFAQGTRLEGVRLSNLHSRPAAVLTYTVPQADGRRLSLVIVDDPEPVLSGESRRVANRQIFVARARGYNVATWRSDDIVYSLISDLDEQDVLRLVQSADLR